MATAEQLDFTPRWSSWVETKADVAIALRELFAEAHRFFAQETSAKEPHRATVAMSGWRSVGVEYSQSPDRPDLNETYCYRLADEARKAVPASTLADLCRTAQRGLDLLAARQLKLLAARCGLSEGEVTERAVRTRSESWLQLNYSRPATAGRTFVQEAHEDGHLVTFLLADANGLEIALSNDEWTPVLPTPERLLCFGGECGALLTGDLISPMPHQVRARADVPLRVSIAYFVNPDLDQTLEPWTRNERNTGVDLLRWGQQNPVRFGLPAL